MLVRPMVIDLLSQISDIKSQSYDVKGGILTYQGHFCL